MTYWHMQLHPNDLSWNREKELLEKKSLIGLGLTDSEQAYKDFKSMQLNDIVLIKHGANPIALVKIIGELEDIKNNDFSQIDWFQIRRKIEVLEFADSNRKDFPQPRKTLQSAEDENTPTYQYINNWYKSITPDLENMQGLKIRKLYIENYNMFKDFNIGFDNDNKALPIIVLAGINGTGKTTILEYINDFVKNLSNNKSFIKFDRYDEEEDKTVIETLNYESSLKEYKIGSRLVEQEAPIKEYFENNIIYLPTDTHHNIEPIENIITEYLKQVVWEENNTPHEAYIEIKDFINSIFDEFSINISFDSLDKNEKVIFTNKNGDKFPLNKISTGEKTLLLKAFYLFIQNIRDKVILIDEPELSLHPSWQSKILKLYEKFAEEYNCQIILSTHSPHIIASAKNEYLRILQIDEKNNINVISDLKAHGRDINSVLFDVMGEVLYRPDEFRKKIDRLFYAIEDEKNYELSKKLFDELKEDYGENDSIILEAKMLISMTFGE